VLNVFSFRERERESLADRFYFPREASHPISLPVSCYQITPSPLICNEALSSTCKYYNTQTRNHIHLLGTRQSVDFRPRSHLCSRICLEQVSRANQRCTSKGAKTRLQGTALGHELVCLLLLTLLTLALCIMH
jgi:hypothetical protein